MKYRNVSKNFIEGCPITTSRYYYCCYINFLLWLTQRQWPTSYSVLTKFGPQKTKWIHYILLWASEIKQELNNWQEYYINLLFANVVIWFERDPNSCQWKFCDPVNGNRVHYIPLWEICSVPFHENLWEVLCRGNIYTFISPPYLVFSSIKKCINKYNQPTELALCF